MIDAGGDLGQPGLEQVIKRPDFRKVQEDVGTIEVDHVGGPSLAAFASIRIDLRNNEQVNSF
jgi:hypothetical protein